MKIKLRMCVLLTALLLLCTILTLPAEAADTAESGEYGDNAAYDLVDSILSQNFGSTALLETIESRPFCSEEVVTYGDGYIFVDHDNLLKLKISTFAQRMDMDTLFRRVDLCVATAEEMADGFFEVLFHNSDFLNFMAVELNASSVEDLERKASELMGQYDISLEKLQSNATVLYVARLASQMNADDVLAFMLQNDGKDIYEFMRYGMERDDDCGKAVTYASLVYGMYNAYAADFGGNSELVERPVSAVQEIQNDAQFRDFLRTEEAKRDLEGFLGILRIANNRTASEKLLCEGFHNEELVSLINNQLNKSQHKCSICGATLSECVPAIIAGKEPTCTETGLTEGQYCLLCGKTLVNQEEIPVAHRFTDYIADGNGLKIASCEYKCGATDTKVDENYQSGDIEISPEEDDNADQDNVTINAGLLEDILNAHKDFCLHFVGDLMDLLFDSNALDTIKNMLENAPNVSLIVQNRTDKTPGQKPDILRFDISLQIGDSILANTNFGAGSVTITIPLDELQLTENQYVKVYHVDGNNRTEMKSERHGNKVSFKTNHFSEYEIVSETCTSHSYENGVCIYCDALASAALIKLEGATMTLSNSLSMNFVVDMDYLVGDGHYAIITRTYADGSKEAVTVTCPQSEWDVYDADKNQKYFSYHGIAAKEMIDELTVTIYNADGTEASYKWTDSPRAYALRAIKDEEAETDPNEDKLALYVDMLNYGAAAQTYFGYKTDDLANEGLSDAQKAYATTAEISVTSKQVKPGEGYKGGSLTLVNEIRLNFVFYTEFVSQDMYAVATYTDHYNNKKEVRIEGEDFKKESSNTLLISVTGMAVADYDQAVTCTVYGANGAVISATDSVACYVLRAKAAEADNPLFDTVLKFGYSAYKAFKK